MRVNPQVDPSIIIAGSYLTKPITHLTEFPVQFKRNSKPQGFAASEENGKI